MAMDRVDLGLNPPQSEGKLNSQRRCVYWHKMACQGLSAGSAVAPSSKCCCRQTPRFTGSGMFSAKRSGFRGSQTGLHHVRLLFDLQASLSPGFNSFAVNSLTSLQMTVKSKPLVYLQAKVGSNVTVMSKEGLHPEYFADAKVSKTL